MTNETQHTRAPSEHPDDDLLADFAAGEGVPPDLAARVNAHVHVCARCQVLLADAERMGNELRAMPPEPMPNDIAIRLDRVLALEQAELAELISFAEPVGERIQADPHTGELPSRRSLRQGTTGQQPAVTDRTPAGGQPARPSEPSPFPLPPSSASPATGSTRRIPIAGRTGTAGGSSASSPAAKAKVGRLSRMNSGGRNGARRQALEEQRSDEPSRLDRLMPALKVAAAAVLVLGVGAGAVKVVSGLGGGSDDAATSAAPAAGNAPPVLAPVLSTGTNYDRADLQKQVRGLVSQSQQSDAVAAPNKGGVTAQEAQPQSSSSVQSSQGSASKAAASGDLLKSSAALRACLTGIGEPDVQPVAVDLARYGGRDAAILVLPSADGQYEVWVVSRNCTADDDGTLDQVTIKT